MCPGVRRHRVADNTGWYGASSTWHEQLVPFTKTGGLQIEFWKGKEFHFNHNNFRSTYSTKMKVLE